jgi:hypothetical protein
MADESVQPLVYLEQGAAKFVVASGGKIDIETGGKILTNGTQGAALTTQLTTITHTAPGTPDYAVQDLTNSSGYGFVTKDEGNSVLSVIKNLQTRVGELESRLQALGLIA